jgi:hypothetical protein
MRLLALAFLLVIAIILFYAAAVILYNQVRPILKTRAVVAAKRREINLDRAMNAETGKPSVTTDYVIDFDLLEGGERLELVVPEAEFDRLREGETGELAYRGRRFFAFRPASILSLNQP